MSQINADLDWDSPYQPQVTTKINAPGINVFWWNIQSGETKRKLAKESQRNSLDHNLLAYATSPERPDIIVLGEYSPDSLDEITVKKLRQIYTYQPDYFWPYNPKTPEIGIMVFSRFPFAVVRQELLDYFPLSIKSSLEAAAYHRKWAVDFPLERFFARTYLNLCVDHPLGRFNLVPFHALTHVEKQFREVAGSFFGVLKIKLDLAFGSQNPLIFQLQRLRKALETDFGTSSDHPSLLIGDFNLPRKISVYARDLTKSYREVGLMGS